MIAFARRRGQSGNLPKLETRRFYRPEGRASQSFNRLTRGELGVSNGDKKSEQEFNRIHKFTPDFVPVEKIKIPGKTTYGIQAMTFADGFFWLGTYGKDRTYQCDAQLKSIAYHAVDASVGVFGLPKGKNGEIRLMVARNVKKDNLRWTTSAAPAILRNGRLEWEK